MVGLDTSHSIEFTKRIQSPDCPEEQKAETNGGMGSLR